MKKRFFGVFFVGILGVVFVYCTTLCFLVGHSDQQGHGGLCALSSHFCVYIKTESSSLFILPLIGVFFPLYITFIPEEFVFLLFKPPQYHA
jgi:hypothetical protein